jgi:hypothetical protein
MSSQFPLGKVNTAQLQELGKALWSWSICTDCLAGKDCKATDCPWSRSTVLNRYFEFFKVSIIGYEYHLTPGQGLGVESYEDLFQIIIELKLKLDLMKADSLEKLFPDRPVRGDRKRALSLAV